MPELPRNEQGTLAILELQRRVGMATVVERPIAKPRGAAKLCARPLSNIGLIDRAALR